ncbi:MAG: Lrp/AsnC family transcriptional regulator, partial [Candidatus Micrarchaeota archaeon]|nr:Lrp/AsnC family transcriptional regulator [Candidatus Micrarchaeota archaeon]
PRDYLLGTERRSVKKEAFFGDVLGKRKLDKLDFSILKRLAQDARAGVNEIASSIGANPNTVAFRMKKLEADGVLVGAVPQVCCQSYGYQSFQAYVETGGLDGKKRKAIGEYAASNPNIIFLIEAMGKWDFEIIYEVRSQKEIRAQIANLRECFPWIRQVQTDMVFDHYVKYDLFPFEKIGE